MTTKTQDAPTSSLATIAADALKGAEQVQKREDTGVVVAGPFPVGGMGEVSVVERASQKGDVKYTFAEFVSSSGGRKKSMPLAAVAALAKELG